MNTRLYSLTEKKLRNPLFTISNVKAFSCLLLTNEEGRLVPGVIIHVGHAERELGAVRHPLQHLRQHEQRQRAAVEASQLATGVKKKEQDRLSGSWLCAIL